MTHWFDYVMHTDRVNWLVSKYASVGETAHLYTAEQLAALKLCAVRAALREVTR